MIWIAIGAARVAWNWLMPTTTVRMSGIPPLIAYVDIDTFCERWTEALQKNTLIPFGPKMYVNPIQIMYVHGRRR